MSKLLVCLLVVFGLETTVPFFQTAQLAPVSTANTTGQQTPDTLVSVLTNRYNTARTGANLGEVILNQSNVNDQQFGKLFSRDVVGHIYAQPLYVPQVEIPGQGVHNVVYVATMHNMVYAFDADDPELSEPLWEVSLGAPFIEAIATDIPGGENGILSTPVIDPDTETIYLVSRNWEQEQAVFKLHALDIRTGAPQNGSPVPIELSMPGRGINNQDGMVYLDASHQLQRTGLLLLNDNLYFGFGSQNGMDWWFGWLPSYSARTLQMTGLFNSTPDAYFGGVWMSGAGITSDGTFLYLATGNGPFTADSGGRDYANSVLKLQHQGDEIVIVDWFTPSHWQENDAQNADIGATGVVLISEANLLVIGSKDSNLYVVDQNTLGQFDPDANTNIQTFSAGEGRMFVTPVYWGSGPAEKPTVYAWTEHDSIKAFTLDMGERRFITEPSSESPIEATGMPIGSLALSANGTVPDSGILWALFAPYAEQGDNSGILVALDATDLTRLLWSSDIHEERDGVGLLSKFNPATVANGKVYVGSFSNRLNVYGLLDNADSGSQ